MKTILSELGVPLLLAVVLCSCSGTESAETENPLFERMSSDRTGITFSNDLVSTEALNTYVFRNFYNGGGVAIGDVNNDGWADIFLTGNQVSNRLYLNRGDFTFEDVTEAAGLASEGVWSTGVAMADVNGDGWLDIYICKSGDPGGERRRNELFINHGDVTFSEQAGPYGLDVAALSIHASFFDYDGDGDLDMYLLSNPIRSLEQMRPVAGLREIPDEGGGNKLFQNDMAGEGGRFVDVTQEAGIYSSNIGFGLGISVGDVNRDGRPDMYISNDFFERDYLYLNTGRGSFDEVLPEAMREISLSSMGGDVADLNQDGYPEIFVSDMLPQAHARLMSKVSFESWRERVDAADAGYHHQYTRNTLQLNRGPRPTQSPTAAAAVFFSEIGRLAGVEASDWSWGGLMADFDLDGRRDLFIPNGIYKDLLDQDFIAEMSDPAALRTIMATSDEPILQIVSRMPSNPIPNRMFAGRPGLRFTDVAGAWGFSEPTFSNGSAYGDLDNDGDLDLVINNTNMGVFVYRNRAAERHVDRSWLRIDLEGPGPNTFAVGAQITAWAGGRQWFVEQQPVRGFQSSVDPTLHLGFGDVLSAGRLDSLVVRWPDGVVESRIDVPVNRRMTLRHQANETTTGSR